MPQDNASRLWQIRRALSGLLGPRIGDYRQYAPRPLQNSRRPPPPLPLDPPAICVVTPVLNQAAFIEAALQSVLQQNYQALCYVVQDGGSTDGTVEILQRYASRLTHVHSGPDGGQAAAINAGFGRCDAEIMGWLNGDDILLPGALATVAYYFAQRPEVDVVYGHRVLIDEAGSEVARWVLPAHSRATLRWMDFVPQETLFWRRRVWERIGARLDEKLRFAMDYDLVLRLTAVGANFYRIPRFQGAFRVHAEQKTSSMSDVGTAETLALLEREHGRVPSPLEIRRRGRLYCYRNIVQQWRWRFGLLRT